MATQIVFGHIPVRGMTTGMSTPWYSILHIWQSATTGENKSINLLAALPSKIPFIPNAPCHPLPNAIQLIWVTSQIYHW